jgi:propane monooxygenase small subunit
VLVRFVLADAEHGAANRDVLSGWLADWTPLAEEAAAALETVFADLPAGIPYEDACANVRIDVDQLREEAGI